MLTIVYCYILALLADLTLGWVCATDGSEQVSAFLGAP